ncbi:MAG TPA: hypothetical protein VFA63_05465, partial [Pseudonocardiaceae bacterium]|nr:hypothetical protein [Pseudonocardiaceae bacterium]
VLRDGNLAGPGDWIVTRDNSRRLAVHGGRDWVKNGDGWRVVRRHPDGSLSCAHLGHGGRVRLPAGYVHAHVELLYATTAHRAEGTTVDTAHPLVTGGMTREMLYVLASRAREKTTLYVATHDVHPADQDEHVDLVKHDPRSYAAREILHGILAAEGSELSATATIRVGQEQAASLATLVPRYLHAACQLAEARYRDAAVLVFGERDGCAVAADPAWGALVRRLYDAETAGWQPARLLAAVARQRELGTADSVAEVLCWRIDGYLPDRVPPAWLEQPSGADAERYARLLATHPALRGVAFDASQAVAVPPGLTVQHEAGHGRDPGAARHAGPRETADAVLGGPLSQRARAEPAWPALEAALRRCERAGHDPAAVLGAVARGRELRTARSTSQTLAWRIGRYLARYPEPVVPHTPAPDGTVDPGTWRMLAWTLKAAENTGTPAETIITAARHARHLGDLLTTARHAALAQSASPGDAELPWLRHPHLPSRGAGDQDLARYLDDAAALISARTRSLAEAAERDRPAWTNLLGHPPDYVERHAQWLHHIGVIAAYRDQHQITTDDPRQVLGPYPEPGRAGHAAYWHAAQSVLAARQLAGLELDRVWEPDPVSAQVAADIFPALPDAERTQLAAAIAAQFGPLRPGPAEPDDDAVTHPACTRHLIDTLTEHGHLTRTMPHVAGPRPLEADLAQRTAARRQRVPQHRTYGSPANGRTPHATTAPEASTTLRRPAQAPRQQQATASPS